MRQIGLCTGFVMGIPMPGGICGEAIVETPQGGRSLSTLRPGDLVETLDAGSQQVLAILRMDRTASPAGPGLAVASGVLGATAELHLKGDQLVLLRGWLVAALFADAEVLVDVGALENGSHVRRDKRDSPFLIPVLTGMHLIRCNGVWLGTGIAAGQEPVRKILNPDAAHTVGESGLFIRRPGERHARLSRQSLSNAH